MNMYTPRQIATFSVKTIAILISLSATSYADTFSFRVAFENVAGIEEISAGNVNASIDVLEQKLAQADVQDEGYILANLCGAHIIDSSLVKASAVCDEAVNRFPGETAFNNRGVLRAFTGDFNGAKKDFDRARPEQLQEYLEQLRTKDVGLIADANYGLMTELSARYSSADLNSSMATNTAAVEEIVE